MTRQRLLFLVVFATASALIGPRSARAYEDQASFDVALGYSLLHDSRDLGRHAATLDVGGALGISDVGALRALAGYASYFEDGAVQHAGRLRLEALYLLDILQFVPFFGVGASLLAAETQRGSFGVRPGAHVLFGADYLLSRTLTIGFDVRTGIAIERGSALSSTDVALRVSRMFELF